MQMANADEMLVCRFALEDRAVIHIACAFTDGQGFFPFVVAVVRLSLEIRYSRCMSI